jgi:hypothetical protein
MTDCFSSSSFRQFLHDFAAADSNEVTSSDNFAAMEEALDAEDNTVEARLRKTQDLMIKLKKAEVKLERKLRVELERKAAATTIQVRVYMYRSDLSIDCIIAAV